MTAQDVVNCMLKNVRPPELPGFDLKLGRTGQGLKRTVYQRPVPLSGKVNVYAFIEQNPHTQSEWAKAARAGHKVVQVTENGRYKGVAVDGKYHPYPCHLQDFGVNL